MTGQERLIEVSETELMRLIRCALFRDSWLGQDISPRVLDQLTEESRGEVKKMADMAP
jgi:hypothetical protein